MKLRWILGVLFLLHRLSVIAQEPGSTEPVVGLRQNRPSSVALVGANVVTQPGESIQDATVLIDGAIISDVGKRSEVVIPPGTEQIDCANLTIYPGFIDAWSEIDVPDPPRDRGASHWNGNVMPQRNSHDAVGDMSDANKKLRSQGITLRVLAPRGGIVQGTSCVVATSDGDRTETLVKNRAWHHLQLTVPQDKSRDRYPNSPMGAVALVRQTFYDAIWYQDAHRVYASATANVPPPENNTALTTLAKDMRELSFVIDAPNERMALRANKIANEFSLNILIKGSGREYRSLDEIVRCRHPILLPINFPEPPNVVSEAVERTVTQTELMHWKLGPENPARLAAAGATICLTSAGLDDTGQFLRQVRTAVERGLPADQALAAITTVPAELLDLEDHFGRIGRGMSANLVIADGDFTAEKTKILTTWVSGERFEIEKAAQAKPEAGAWAFDFSATTPSLSALRMQVTEEGQVKFTSAMTESEADSPPAAELQQVTQERHRIQGVIDLSRLDESWPRGHTRVTLLYAAQNEGTDLVNLTLRLPDGTLLESVGEPLGSSKEKGTTETPEADEEPKTSPTDPSGQDAQPPEVDVLYPLGAYGLAQAVPARGPVLLSGATLWTSGPAGVLEDADILIRDGKIAEIGKDLPVSEDVEVIRLGGKHISPGLIDCHSHIATDGGVNESGQAITSEVRISDFIDPTAIAIYRQLAGGVTTANVLHGSANPIGGQNCVIKLRWGSSMDGMVMRDAPEGIKFALGENVKQSNSGRSGRYPGSRMGVEQIIRDQLLAARFYDAEHRRYRSGARDRLPPRTDLQLEALAEVVRGERWIHCHSYRQDEIVAFLDTLDELNIQVGTLQHVLEGYKVAERLKQHGAMASSFADWWGYKFEVFDAIPYNGALMHREGVVVSFNSDDAELA
ncbi:MAG: amidohydrolase family protein, partial [Planctomycetaceae bacterium]